MRIGTLGAGAMTEALAARIGARAGSIAEAAEFGDVLLLAVLSGGLKSTIEATGPGRGALAGKTVIDCGNAVELGDYSQVTWDGRCMTEEAQRLAPGSHVVKAFNLCHADVWKMAPPEFDGRRLFVPIAGDDSAKIEAAPLIRDLGADPVDVGDITQARHLEAMAIVMIRLLRSGVPALSAFNLVSAPR